MANYESTMRTNYFHVTNDKRFKEIFHSITEKNEDVKLFTGDDHTYGFGSYHDVDMNDVFELQEIIPEGDCIIVMEAGHESLRYVDGIGYVITKDKVETLSIMELVKQKAQELLKNPDYETQIDY